jgi:acyl-CoA thioesterase I
MSVFLFLFGSGWAFFLAAALALGGLAVRTATRRRWLDRVACSSVDIGLVLGLLSAVPLSWFIYAALVATTLVWRLREKPERARQPEGNRRLAWIRSGMVGAWLLACVLELPYHVAPQVALARGAKVEVIGDSLTAGIGEKVTWPELLADHTGLHVTNLAQPAATTASALDQARRLSGEASLVIVEIGGNDLLGDNSAAGFEADLEVLLTQVRLQNSQVLMFELPLPPTYNGFGAAQRRVARRHGVLLLPKRHLMSVLARRDGTSDSLHLTPSGHQWLAEIVERTIVVEGIDAMSDSLAPNPF